MTLARATKVLHRRLRWLERRVEHKLAEHGADANVEWLRAEIAALGVVLGMFAAPKEGTP